MASPPSPEPPPHTDVATQIEVLIAQLSAHDVAVRDVAGASLVGAGEAAVPALVAVLDTQGHTARLEATRCLREIRSPTAASALVAALSDERHDVRWVAAEALAALGRAGVSEVLLALEQADWSAEELREGAHTVFGQLHDKDLARVVAPVQQAIKGPEPGLSVPLAAYKARESLGLI